MCKLQTSPEVWVVLPVDGPEDAVEEVLAAEGVEVVEGAAEDEPVGEAHRVDQAGHLLEADALESRKRKYMMFWTTSTNYHLAHYA